MGTPLGISPVEKPLTMADVQARVDRSVVDAIANVPSKQDMKAEIEAAMRPVFDMLGQLKGEVGALKGEVTELKTSMAAIGQALSNSTRERDALRQDVTRLEEQATNLGEKAAKTDKKADVAIQATNLLRRDILGTDEPNAPKSVVSQINEQFTSLGNTIQNWVSQSESRSIQLTRANETFDARLVTVEMFMMSRKSIEQRVAGVFKTSAQGVAKAVLSPWGLRVLTSLGLGTAISAVIEFIHVAGRF